MHMHDDIRRVIDFDRLYSNKESQQNVMLLTVKLKLKLKPDKFFMGNPVSELWGVKLPYTITQYYLSPDTSEHTLP